MAGLEGCIRHIKKEKAFLHEGVSCPRQINNNLHKQASSDIVSAVETYLFNMNSFWSW